MVEPAATKRPQEPVPILETRDLTISYGSTPAVCGVSLAIPERRITAIIGPSGCGKTTLLRAFNRMNEFIPSATTEGQVLYHGEDLYAGDIDPVEVRRRIGMVFQKPNPFPKSVFRNVGWGPSINGFRGNLAQRVEQSLRKAALWDEVKDKLQAGGLELSGGQQQRLCIARAIAMEPEVILMDEPCSALDPASTARIEDLLFELKERYTIVVVTHNMQQAARLADYTAFLCQGRLVEFGPTDIMFTRPMNQETQDYVTGKFG
ncbi:MAG: phosphate ABC transporter ATP-binding protein [Planctomycetes bacterium]|nr:phosphate ABC transporter ATP-binding protein [Planctomycetota bacterium]